MFQFHEVREATRDKKQLNFGFLLNRLDPPYPPVSLDMFEELFFQPHIKQAKVPQKVWILVRPPPLFLENVQTLAGKVPHKVWI